MIQSRYVSGRQRPARASVRWRRPSRSSSRARCRRSRCSRSSRARRRRWRASCASIPARRGGSSTGSPTTAGWCGPRGGRAPTASRCGSSPSPRTSPSASPLARAAQPAVTALHDRTGATAHLAVPSYRSTLCLVQRAGGADARPQVRELVPAHACAGGKVLLGAPRIPGARACSSCRSSRSPSARSSTPTRLREECAAIEARGFAIEDGEYRPELEGMAVPVAGADGEVTAAVVLTGARPLAVPGQLEAVRRRRPTSRKRLRRMTAAAENHARVAYDALAPGYDLLTAGTTTPPGRARSRRLAVEAGLRGRAGCSTSRAGRATRWSRWPSAATTPSGSTCPPRCSTRRAASSPGVRLRRRRHARRCPCLGRVRPDLCARRRAQLPADGGGARGRVRRLPPQPRAGRVVVFDLNTLATFRALYSSLLAVPAEDRIVIVEGRGTPRPAERRRRDGAHRPPRAPSPGWWGRVRTSTTTGTIPSPSSAPRSPSAGLECRSVHGRARAPPACWRPPLDGASGHDRRWHLRRHAGRAA